MATYCTSQDSMAQSNNLNANDLSCSSSNVGAYSLRYYGRAHHQPFETKHFFS